MQEAAERGYIPYLITPKAAPASLVAQELQEVGMRAEVLFSSCPDARMTLHREELATLTHEVCVLSALVYEGGHDSLRAGVVAMFT